MRVPDDRSPHVEVRNEDELHGWLEEHYDRDEAVWLVTWKKAVPARYVSTEQTGSVRRRLDDERVVQLVSAHGH